MPVDAKGEAAQRDSMTARIVSLTRAISVLAAGSTRVASASALTQLATLGASVLVANVVGVAGFGLYAFVAASAGTALLVVQASVGLMAVRSMAHFIHGGPTQAGQVLRFGPRTSFWLGLLAACIFTAFAWRSRAEISAGVDNFEWALLAMSIAVVCTAVAQFQHCVLMGLQDWSRVIKFSVIGAIAKLLLPSVGGLLMGGAGACLGFAIASVLRCIVGRQFQNAATLSVRKSDPTETSMRELLRDFALPAFLIASSFAGSLWFGNAYLLSQPDGARHLGIFAAANMLRTLVVFLPSQLGATSLAAMSAQRVAGRVHEYRQLHMGSILLAAVIASLVATVIAIAAPLLLPLFGPDFVAARPIVFTIMVASVLESIALAAYQHINSSARLWRSLFLTALPRDAIFITCTLLLVPIQFEMGLAIALIAGQLTMLVSIVASGYLDRRTRS